MGLLDKWNKNRISVYDSEEKTALKLIDSFSTWFDETLKQVDENTKLSNDNKNKKVSYDELHNKYKLTLTGTNSNFNGMWQGLNRPTLSEEGMRATVEQLHDVTIPNINSQLEHKANEQKSTMYFLDNINKFKVGTVLTSNKFYDSSTSLNFNANYEVVGVTGNEVWNDFNNSFKISNDGYLSPLTITDKKLKYITNDYVIPDMLGADNSPTFDNTLILQICLNNFEKTFLLARNYKITSLVIPQAKTIIGLSMRKSILYSDTSGYMLLTKDGEVMTTIQNISLISNKVSDGIRIVNGDGNSSTALEGSHVIKDVFIKSCRQAIQIDKLCTGTRLLNLKIEYCTYGINIHGTDGYYSNISIGEMDDYGITVTGNSYLSNIKTWCCNRNSGTHAFIINSKASTIVGCSTQQNYKSGILVNGESNLIEVVNDSNGWYNSSLREVYGVDVVGSYNNIKIAERTGLWQCYQTAPVVVRKSAFFNNIDITTQNLLVRSESYSGYYANNYECVLEIKESCNDVKVNGKVWAKISDIKKSEYDFSNFILDGGNVGTITKNGEIFNITLDNFNTLPSGKATKNYFNIDNFKTLLNAQNKQYLVLQYKIKANTRKLGANVTIRNNGKPYEEAMVYSELSSYVNRQYSYVNFVYDAKMLKDNQSTLTFSINCYKTDNFSGNSSENVEQGLVDIVGLSFYFSDGKTYNL